VLYQAGTSPRGRQFAARHAECVFLSGPSEKVIAPRVADIRQLAKKYGRDPNAIKMFSLMTVILAATDDEAKAKYEDYRRFASHEGALTLMSGWTGVDFSKLDLDEEVRYVTNEAGRSAIDNITRADPNRVWTVRQVAEHVAIGGIGPVVTGSPQTVADRLQDWVDATDVDGFNLAYVVAHETFKDIVDLLVPELQRRGLYKHDYPIGTLREKLFGAGGARLTLPHPAAALRSAHHAKAAAE
jgi:alkanesulfonate monooxygenase